jgi:hypothetical protein
LEIPRWNDEDEEDDDDDDEDSILHRLHALLP